MTDTPPPLPEVPDQIQRLWLQVLTHPPTAECEDDECMVCGMRDCPDHEPLHYHHDGCPCCSQRPAPQPFDFHAHLRRQRAFSERTFGPGTRTAGVIDHIRKELREIEADPSDISEWIDVVILGLDGAWRAGHSPEQIVSALVAKQDANEARTWPDWRTAPTDKAIEHDRPADPPRGEADQCETPQMSYNQLVHALRQGEDDAVLTRREAAALFYLTELTDKVQRLTRELEAARREADATVRRCNRHTRDADRERDEARTQRDDALMAQEAAESRLIALQTRVEGLEAWMAKEGAERVCSPYGDGHADAMNECADKIAALLHPDQKGGGR